MAYWFYYSDNRPIPGVLDIYTDNIGNACVGVELVPSWRDTHYADCVAFVPIEALSCQQSGPHHVYANMAIFEGDIVLCWVDEVVSFLLRLTDRIDQPQAPPMLKPSAEHVPKQIGKQDAKKHAGAGIYDAFSDKQYYHKMFSIPHDAGKDQIWRILTKKYNTYRRAAESSDPQTRQEAEQMLSEIEKARKLFLA